MSQVPLWVPIVVAAPRARAGLGKSQRTEMRRYLGLDAGELPEAMVWT